MAPTRLGDGTNIDSIRLGDGTGIAEVRTGAGDVVFSAFSPPVAYQNLIAWYPFDSSFYGGSNADDVTAIIGGSGDDTAYDGTVVGATYQSSGGGTDINAGPNSGAFDFDGSNDRIELPTDGFDWSNKSISVWSNSQARDGGVFMAKDGDQVRLQDDAGATFENDGSFGSVNLTNPQNQWVHFCLTNDGSTVEAFVDGSSQGTDSWPGPVTTVPDLFIGANNDVEFGTVTNFYDGLIDDFRIYNKRLTSSEVNQIITNTPHP